MEQEFDYTAFALRLKLKQREAADLIGVKMSLIAAWSSKRAVPSYESMGKLIEAGMTAKELFGEEMAKKLLENSNSVQTPAKPTTDELKASIREVMKDLLDGSSK